MSLDLEVYKKTPAALKYVEEWKRAAVTEEDMECNIQGLEQAYIMGSSSRKVFEFLEKVCGKKFEDGLIITDDYVISASY